MKQKVAIIGATGYSGGELLRLLCQHPQIEVSVVTSNRSVGENLTKRHPFLKGYYDLILEKIDIAHISKKADIIFVALSHTTAMKPVAQFIRAGKKVIDLSADYRFKSKDLYEKWYMTSHSEPDLLEKSVYGLSEIYREEIKKTQLVANPGCYPTGTLLPLYPFFKKNLVDFSREIIIDAKSGVSGAGRNPSQSAHFPEVNETLLPYKLGSHGHLPEINQVLGDFSGQSINTIFTPYLLPVNRGILTTIYLPLQKKWSVKELRLIMDYYKNDPFIRLCDMPPTLSSVKGSKHCDIGVFESSAPNTAIIISAIDNLVKGAAGQAIQNMNIMMGWDETLGLKMPGFFP